MVFLLGAVACTSLVNIVLAFASRRGWDGRAVLGWSYFASAALAGLMAALQTSALSFPAPGQLAGALTGGHDPGLQHVLCGVVRPFERRALSAVPCHGGKKRAGKGRGG